MGLMVLAALIGPERLAVIRRDGYAGRRIDRTCAGRDWRNPATEQDDEKCQQSLSPSREARRAVGLTRTPEEAEIL